jgi:hypothetical protein
MNARAAIDAPASLVRTGDLDGEMRVFGLRGLALVTGFAAFLTDEIKGHIYAWIHGLFLRYL